MFCGRTKREVFVIPAETPPTHKKSTGPFFSIKKYPHKIRAGSVKVAKEADLTENFSYITLIEHIPFFLKINPGSFWVNFFLTFLWLYITKL